MPFLQIRQQIFLSFFRCVPFVLRISSTTNSFSQTVKNWYHNHGKLPDADAKDNTCPPINLDGKKRRKPVRLTSYQAYSAVFFTKGSPLQIEVAEAYRLYVEKDPPTLIKYGHFLPGASSTTVPFLTFQQAIMRDKLLTASDDELAEVEEYIKSRLDHDNQVYQEPWYVMKKNDDDPSEDLEKQYVTAYVDPTPDHAIIDH